MARGNRPDRQPRMDPAPAMSPEARENQMIALAIDVAEEQLRNRTASSQVVTHYLKLAAERERYKLELIKLEHENSLLEARTEAIKSEKRSEELYAEAIKAMGIYGGHHDSSDTYDQDL